MKKHILTYFLALVSFLSVDAQNAEADSLKRLLSNTADDSIRVYLMYKISDAYYETAPDTAMQFALNALSLAEQIGSKRGQARSLNRVGNVYEATGEYLKALETYLASLKLNEEINDELAAAASNNNIARVYTEQNVGDDNKKALIYYLKAKEIYEKQKDSLRLCITLLNIGDNYEKMNMLDSALFFQTQAYNMARQIQDVDYIGTILVNLGYLHYLKGNMDAAFKDLQQGILYLQAIEDNQSLADAWLSMAQFFEKSGKADSSEFYARKALALSVVTDNLSTKLVAANHLFNHYSTRRIADSVLLYNSIVRSTDSIINNKDKLSQLAKLQIKEDIRQHERELEEKRRAKKLDDTIEMFAITVFIVTFFIILLILTRKKINPKAIQALSILGLLLVFEFIMIFIHPIVGDITHHRPLYMLILFVGIAAVLGPLHHYLNHWLQHKLLNRMNKHKHQIKKDNLEKAASHGDKAKGNSINAKVNSKISPVKDVLPDDKDKKAPGKIDQV